MKNSIIFTAVLWHTVYSFTCTSRGTFSNPDDSTCQTYIYCVQLPSGIYFSNIYSCPSGNFFNPSVMNCDQNFICSTTVTEETTQITTPSIQDEFTCVAQGRFPDSKDTTCSNYYFCYYLTNGQYNKQNYSCPQGSRFDPESQACSTTYECGQNTSASTVDAATTMSSSFECTAQGRFPVEDDLTCSTYYFCYYLPSGQYSIRNYSCPQGSRFDPNSQTCNTIYECGKNTAASTVDDVTTISPSFECTAQGRFAVETDVNCTSYYFCYYLTSGRYMIYNYTCPSNSRFDPILQTCSGSYDCTATSISTISSSSDVRLVRVSNQRCTTQGRFPVESDDTCRSYYFCYYTINSQYVEYNYICPNGSRFDESSQTCSTTYICARTQTTALLTSTSSSFEITTEATTTKLPFECINQGRFSVEDDNTCRSYYYCIYLTNGTYISEKYKCPSGTQFDPNLQLCSETFQCISSSGVTIRTNFPVRMIGNEVKSYNAFQCVSSGKFPELRNTFCQNYIYCITLPNGDFAQQVYKCAVGEKFDPELQTCSQIYQCSSKIKSENKVQSYYKCLTKGKFLVEEDPTCRTYHYCISYPNEEFGHQLYSCPSEERFDPKTQTCSMSYQCPHFKCSTEGKFLAKEDSTCQTYYYCFSLSNGLFGKQLYTCAAGEKFDSKFQICSQNYQCSS